MYGVIGRLMVAAMVRRIDIDKWVLGVGRGGCHKRVECSRRRAGHRKHNNNRYLRARGESR